MNIDTDEIYATLLAIIFVVVFIVLYICTCFFRQNKKTSNQDGNIMVITISNNGSEASPIAVRQFSNPPPYSPPLGVSTFNMADSTPDMPQESESKEELAEHQGGGLEEIKEDAPGEDEEEERPPVAALSSILKDTKPATAEQNKSAESIERKGSRVVLRESAVSMKGRESSPRMSKIRRQSGVLQEDDAESRMSRLSSRLSIRRESSVMVTEAASVAQDELLKDEGLQRQLSSVSAVKESRKNLAVTKYAKLERRSKIGLGRTSSASFVKQGAGDTDKGKQGLKYMNTYRLESKSPFKPEIIKKLLIATIDKEFQDVKYDPQNCAKQCLTITNELRAKVKQQGYDRY